jgi:hypothetical protein
MSRENLERQLPTLLHDAAEQVRPDVDVRQQIAAQLLAHTREAQTEGVAQTNHVAAAPTLFDGGAGHPRQSWQGGHRRRPRLVAASLISMLLLVPAVAVARPLVLSWFGDQSLQQVALQDGTPIHKAVTVQGVTMMVEDGYADAARTVLTMQITSSGGGANDSYGPSLPSTRLVDAAGTSHAAFTGSQLNRDALFEFLPLPTGMLGTPQPLTLVIDAMQRSTGGPTPHETTVNGPWQITFLLKPQAGRVIALDVAPQTYGGVTLQPEELDLTPAGVRLLVRESGLPSDTSLFSVKHFATHQDDIVACPPGQQVCASLSGTSDGANMHISAGSAQTLVPGWVNVVNPPPEDGVPIGQQPIGPAGTVEIEFLFFAPIKTTQGPARVIFDDVRYASDMTSSAPEQTVAGPWSFTVPLS